MSFRKQIAPLFLKHCGSCHIGSTRGEFSLRTYAEIITEINNTAIIPGDLENSVVMQLIDDEVMPPERKKRLDSEEIELLRQWIREGAVFDGKETEHRESIATLIHKDKAKNIPDR